MLWGIVWIACYVTTHLLLSQPAYIGWVWLAGNAIGLGGMAMLFTVFGRRPDVRSQSMRKLGWRMFWFWIALALFGNAWLVMLWPWYPLQMNAFLVTLIMFAYVVIGLWMDSRFMIVLGAAVAIGALAGYLLTMFGGFTYYNLWMAMVGGGGLFGSGLYMRLAWR
ncbi:MAG: hypothetical protein WD534_01180 [Phycisphaeraceae bacterium]